MYFEELKIGASVELAPAVIERDKMLTFAREYDDVPIHTDEEYAKSTPFGTLLAPGVMSFLVVWVNAPPNVSIVMIAPSRLRTSNCHPLLIVVTSILRARGCEDKLITLCLCIKNGSLLTWV